MKFKWSVISLTDDAFAVVFDSLPNKIIRIFSPMFSSRSFMVSGFTFSSIVHFKFLFESQFSHL